MPTDKGTIMPKRSKDPATCVIDGCGRPIRVKRTRLCRQHQRRLDETGVLGGTIQARNPGICSATGCATPKVAHGLCPLHARRAKRDGLIPTKPVSAYRERFFSRVAWNGTCLEWTHAVNSKGYGMMLAGARVETAHRLAWYFEYGDFPDHWIDHKCGNRRCVNIEHLRPADAKTNAENRTAPWMGRSLPRGVSKTPAGHYTAGCTSDGVYYHLGTFKTIAEAESAVIAKRNEVMTHNVERKIA